MKHKFKEGWEKQALPISGRVVVVDKSDSCKVGLSAMQMNSLGSIGDATLMFKNKESECSIWNAMGMRSTDGESDIRITDKAAEALGCKKGDWVSFVAVSKEIKPIKI